MFGASSGHLAPERFDWEPVANAAWYELDYKANAGAAYVQLSNDYPASVTSARFRLPVHLFDWTNARYRVAACNSAGCTRSNAVSVSGLRRDTDRGRSAAWRSRAGNP